MSGTESTLSWYFAFEMSSIALLRMKAILGCPILHTLYFTDRICQIPLLFAFLY